MFLLRVVAGARPWFARRSTLWLAALGGAVLCLPAVSTGFQLDDYRYIQTFMGTGWSVPTWLERFSWLEPFGDVGSGIDVVGLPWWADPSIQSRLYRPMSWITHAVDFAGWASLPSIMHLHSLLWYAALIAMVGLFYRRFEASAWLAGLAVVLYAVDDAHSLPAGWLAHRNTLIAAFFGVAALLAHDRWRRDRWLPGAILSQLSLVASLLAKESGIATVAYLLSYQLFLDRGGWPRKIAGLVPPALVVAAWLLGYHALGYGSSGGGVYIDPFRAPFAFLVEFSERALLLGLSQFGQPAAVWSYFVSAPLYVALCAAAALFLALILLALRPLLRSDATVRFYSAGALLSILPACVATPHERLLEFVGLGGSALIARLIGAGLDPAAGARRPLGAVLVVCHLLLAPALLAFNSRFWARFDPYYKTAFTGVLPRIAGKTTVIVRDPVTFGPMLWNVQALYPQTLPKQLRVLAPGIYPVSVTRTSANQMVFALGDGFLRPGHRPHGRGLDRHVSPSYFAQRMEQTFRGARTPMRRGDKVFLTGMVVEVLDVTAEGHPARVSFTFNIPLEDESIAWIDWQPGGFVSWQPPAVGGTLELSPVPIHLF